MYNKVKYKQYKNLFKQCLRSAERDYFSKKLMEKNSSIKDTWKVINTILNKSHVQDHIRCLTIDNSRVTDRKEIVQQLNNYFTNIGQSLTRNIPDSINKFTYYMDPPKKDTMQLVPTNETEILSIIKNLKNTSSTGNDDIPSSVIKYAANSIAKPMAILINSAMQEGVFPSALKIAKVIPIYKGDSHTLLSNYRPISILPVFSKIYEKAIVLRLNSFIEKNEILNNKQFGFRKNHSTSMALVTFTDYITENLDLGNSVISVFIDLSKAFDTVDHQILFKKLYNYGLRGNVLNLIIDYLSSRFQYVALDDCCSTLLPINCGVPQGSILGPILFLLYVNDIAKNMKFAQILLFADDTTIYIASKKLETLINLINSELKILSDWFLSNKLTINVNKTKYMLFRSSKNKEAKLDMDIYINNFKLSGVNSTKFLGIEFDDCLNWKLHISSIERKLSCAIGVISKIRYKLNMQCALLLYNSMILSQLSYCTMIWASTYKSALHRIYLLQKRALRVCSLSGKKLGSTLFQKYKKLTIYDLLKLQILKFIYQSVHKLLPKTSVNIFQESTNIHDHNTRRNKKLFTKLARLNIRKNSIAVQGPILWNAIPENLQNALSLKQFVSMYKSSVYLK